MMRVLITGGSGFVGINLLEEFLSRGDDVWNYDSMPLCREAESSCKALPGNYSFIMGNVLDDQALLAAARDNRIDTVVHTAVVTTNEARERTSAYAAFEVNCGGTLRVLDMAAALKIPRVIYVSSIAVYGKTAHSAKRLTEDMENLTPRNLYEISKFSSEKLALRYKALYNMNLTAVRLGDVFGPWERPTAVRETMSAPYQTFQFAREGKAAVLPRQNRTSWVYSRDVAAAVRQVALRQDLPSDVYNISSRFEWSIEEWCSQLAVHYPAFQYRLTKDGEKATILYHDDTDNAPMDVTRLMREAGYVPHYDLDASLKDYLIWTRQHSQSDF